MALIDCPECNNTVSDQAAACPHCGFAVASRLTVPPPLPATPPPLPVQVFKCPSCGADVERGATDCAFCGSHVQVVTARHGVECLNCHAALVEGQSFCEACGALQFMTDQLRAAANRVQFSQNKLRAQFHPDICKSFLPEEFIHDHTYGPDEYYILSDRRLYIGAVVRKGIFKRRFELAGLNRIVEMNRATLISSWSNTFLRKSEEYEGREFITLQIETFDGDVGVTVDALQYKAPFYSCPYTFQGSLDEVLENIQKGHVTYEEALWRAK